MFRSFLYFYRIFIVPPYYTCGVSGKKEQAYKNSFFMLYYQQILDTIFLST